MVKNYKGGYKIIALGGINLVADGEYEIKGIHKSIEASYQKPLLIEGIIVDGVEKNAVWVKELKVVDGSFVIELYGLKLTITAEDEITVESTEPQERKLTEEEVDELNETPIVEDNNSYGTVSINVTTADMYKYVGKTLIAKRKTDNSIKGIVKLTVYALPNSTVSGYFDDLNDGVFDEVGKKVNDFYIL